MGGYDPARTGHNPTESTIDADNVATLEVRWTATTGGEIYHTAAVAHGLAYVGSDDGTLYVFDADARCEGDCAPLWTADVGGNAGRSTPAVVGGTLYVSTFPGGLFAFDARGESGCSGTPKTCTPLWSAPGAFGAPAVVGGVVYTPALDGVLAFDARGVEGCSGVPKVCTPLWHGTTPGLPDEVAVADGVLYADTEFTLYAFDAAGEEGCTPGAVRACTPLWTGTPSCPADATCFMSAPTVANGSVFVGVGAFELPDYGELLAFDADGTDGCSGQPTTCAPIWRGVGPTHPFRTPIAADGLVFVGGARPDEEGQFGSIAAYDATGTTGCTGSPKVCQPVWRSRGDLGLWRPSAVANGVLYVGNGSQLSAYDAAGDAQCSGTPRVCTPLAELVTGPDFAYTAAVSNGAVYISASHRLITYMLP
jgi:outer membrane protein assembly factor BamB